MKSYDELKAEVESIYQQMVEATKNGPANALKEVTCLALMIRFSKVRWLTVGKSHEIFRG